MIIFYVWVNLGFGLIYFFSTKVGIYFSVVDFFIYYSAAYNLLIV
jgi:hypothetical protein